MKIIKVGDRSDIHRITCGVCETIFEIYTSEFTYMSWDDDYRLYSIECPVCGMTNNIREKYE